MRTINYYFIILLGLAFYGCGVQPQQPYTPPTVQSFNFNSTVGTVVDSVVQAESIPGLSIGMISKGKIAWTQGYGVNSLSSNLPVTNESRFKANQAADVMVAVAVMQLVERGLLDIDADINDYLEHDLTNARFPQAIISTRMLLAHTGGINDDEVFLATLYGNGTENVSLQGFLKDYLYPDGQYFNANHFTSSRPGKTFSYSRVGLSLAAQIVEEITEVEFDLYCKTHLFTQLGYSDVSWLLSEIKLKERLAVPHTNNSGNVTPQLNYAYPMYPGGQLRISAEHLSRFLLAMANGGLYGNQRLLTAPYVEAINQITYPGSDPGQALGWGYKDFGGMTLLGSSGNDTGFSSRMYWNPASEKGVVILTNGEGYEGALDFLVQAALTIAEGDQ